MNKSLVLAVAVAAFTLAACGKKEEPAAPPPAPAAAPAPAPAPAVAASDAAATLTVDGVPSAVRIEASRPVTVVLTPAQARGASLAPVSGSVVVATRIDRPLDTDALEAPEWLSPARVVKPSSSIGVADTVVVLLRMQAPARASEGCWLVTEWVPSGLVPVTAPYGWQAYEDDGEDIAGGDGPWNVQGQRLDFCLQRHDDTTREVTLRYVARVVTPGTYAWEPAVVQSPLETGVGAVIPATTVTIRGER